MDTLISRLLSYQSFQIQKSKKYLKPGQKPPKGQTSKKGPEGGTYYETESHLPGKIENYAKPIPKGKSGHIKKKQLPKFRPSVNGLHHHTTSGVHGPGTYVITREPNGSHHLHFSDGKIRLYLGKSNKGSKPLKQRVGEFKEGKNVIPEGVDPDKYQELVKNLTPRHYDHVMKVTTLAVDMAKRSGNDNLNIHHVRDAAMLHDIGKDVNPEKHGKVAENYIKETDLVKNPEEKNIIGKVVAEHGGCHPVNCKTFSDEQCDSLKAMLPIIRIADALSRSSKDVNPVLFDHTGKIILQGLNDTRLDQKRKDRIKCNVKLYNSYLAAA